MKQKSYIEIKSDIKKRLRNSDKQKWDNLSNSQKEKAVNEYIRRRSIDHLGIDKVLEDNRNIRLNSSFMIMGLLLGIFGNILANIIQKNIPQNIIFDFALTIISAIVILFIYHKIEKGSAEMLGEEKVIENLLVNTDNKDVAS